MLMSLIGQEAYAFRQPFGLRLAPPMTEVTGVREATA